MKYIKRLIVDFTFDLTDIKNLIIDELGLSQPKFNQIEKDQIIFKNFYFFAKNNNQENKLFIKKNIYLESTVMNFIINKINNSKDKEKLENEFEENIKENLILIKLYYQNFSKKKRFKKAEPIILQDVSTAKDYFLNCFKEGETWSEAEDLFSNDYYAAVAYIQRTNKRFLKAEKMLIETDPRYCYSYSVKFNFRFKEAEPKILEYQNDLINYIKHLNKLNEKWPEAIEFIFKNSYLSVEYCKDVLESRDSRAEDTILKDEKSYYNIADYAELVIKDRWEEGEKRLLEIYLKEKHIDILYNYIKKIKKRILLFEPYIAKSDKAINYVMEVLGKRWEECEKYLAESENIDDLIKYVKFTGYIWEEAEKRLIFFKDDKFGNVSLYFLENFIKNNNISNYIKNFINEIFLKIKTSKDFIEFNSFLNSIKHLDVFKEIFNQKLKSIIKTIDVNDIEYKIIQNDSKDYGDINYNKYLDIRYDFFINLINNNFLKYINDQNKKELEYVQNIIFNNILKKVKKHKLYKYLLYYKGYSLTPFRDNPIVKEIIDLFNSQRGKDYNFLNGKEETDRINSIKDPNQHRKEIEKNTLLIKMNLENTI